ncbi:uncharacterized protein LOC116836056 [Chelonoidis abingdonii]|uniref:uncharacterized protein LOC116836056 n=1 Tax=Chelonoidis abingdonii TaxID=106734 RepID=UPI0013F252B8|nr:aggrecan core protein-like [Chelonoidis abingdonii]
MQNVSPTRSTHSHAAGKKLEDEGLTASPAIVEGKFLGPALECTPFLSDMGTLRWWPGCLGPFLVTLLLRSPSPVASSNGRSCPCTQGCCPAGWYQYRDFCYYPVTATKGWWEAERDCKDLAEGAHLASVHSAEENNFIYQLMGTSHNYKRKEAYWLGGSRDSQVRGSGEGSWRWTDGSAWHYHNFGNSESDGTSAEAFVATWKFDEGRTRISRQPLRGPFRQRMRKLPSVPAPRCAGAAAPLSPARVSQRRAGAMVTGAAPSLTDRGGSSRTGTVAALGQTTRFPFALRSGGGSRPEPSGACA